MNEIHRGWRINYYQEFLLAKAITQIIEFIPNGDYFRIYIVFLLNLLSEFHILNFHFKTFLSFSKTYTNLLKACCIYFEKVYFDSALFLFM